MGKRGRGRRGEVGGEETVRRNDNAEERVTRVGRKTHIIRQHRPSLGTATVHQVLPDNSPLPQSPQWSMMLDKEPQLH